MRRVVVLGFLWPYISGSKRTIGLARHLGANGWEPTVVTPPLPKTAAPDFRVVQTDYSGLFGGAVRAIGLSRQQDLGGQLKDRVSQWPPFAKSVSRWSFRLACELLAYPDEHKGWRRYAVDAVERLAQRERIDGIISVWPVTSHVVARDIKHRLGLPWIADLADLWSDNSAYPYGFLRRVADRWLETRTLHDADLLTTSSPPLAERLQRLHPRHSVVPIMMGFDPELLTLPAAPTGHRFSIVYTGMFYRHKRDPSRFLQAVSELVSAGSLDPARLDIRFYGSPSDWVEERIREYGLADVVRQCAPVPHDICQALQRQAQVLLQINWSDPAERGVFSGKFLDYLAARRPILAAGGAGADDVVAGILAETRAGIYAPSVDEIKAALMQMYAAYRQSGTAPFHGDVAAVARYSNHEMARRFAGALEQIVQSRRGTEPA